MLEAGDKVQYTGEGDEYIYKGAVGIIEEKSFDGINIWANWDKAKTGVLGNKLWCVSIDKVKLVEENTMLKKGDKVKIIGVNWLKANNYIGKEGRVICISMNGDVEVEVPLKRGSASTWFPLKSLKKIEPKKMPESKPVKKPDTFYCCYVDGTGGFAYKHSTEDKAVKEAERLARKENRKVYVLKAIKSCEIPDSPVKWNNL